MYRVAKEAHFAAAHHLRDYCGKCENVHGHNYRVVAVVEGKALPKNGLLIDFVDLKAALMQVVEPLDHIDLNAAPPFDVTEPSAENLAAHIFNALAARLDSDRVRMSEVQVWESPTSCATYTRDE